MEQTSPALGPSVQELRAAHSVDIQGVRSFDEVLHLGFDADGLGTVWVYRFGRLRGGEESQIFCVHAPEGLYRVFAVPEALQRLPFHLLRVGQGTVFLLGSGPGGSRVPTGFALDLSGRVLCGLHPQMAAIDALPGAGGLWLVGQRAGVDPAAGLCLELWTPEDLAVRSIPLQGWTARQFGCLASARGGLLLGGVAEDGSTRIERYDRSGMHRLPCADIGLPSGIGLGPTGEVLALDPEGTLHRLTAHRWDPDAASAEPPLPELAHLRLLDPLGAPVGRVAQIRILYRRLYALTAARDRILEFHL